MERGGHAKPVVDHGNEATDLLDLMPPHPFVALVKTFVRPYGQGSKLRSCGRRYGAVYRHNTLSLAYVSHALNEGTNFSNISTR